MANTTTIERLAYDPVRDVVSADLTAAMGGRAVHLQLRFPFRHHGDRPTTDLRVIALTEMQQILRSAANITLPDFMNAGDGTVGDLSTSQAGTDRWENEGGSAPAHPQEIVWIGNCFRPGAAVGGCN